MTASVFFAMSLPGLLLALVVVAAVERIASRGHRRSLITGEHRPMLGATALEVFNAVVDPGRTIELEIRDDSKILRIEASDGTRIDLDSGSAKIGPAPSTGRVAMVRGSAGLRL